MSTASIRRVAKELKDLHNKPIREFVLVPLEDNMLEVHFTLMGPEDSPYAGGLYHGRVIVPSEYPFAPPDVVLLTPNGRFELGKKVCLSVSSYHPEHWKATWGIATILHSLRSFMLTPGTNGIASVNYPAEKRRELAKESRSFVCKECGCAVAQQWEEVMKDAPPATDADKGELLPPMPPSTPSASGTPAQTPTVAPQTPMQLPAAATSSPSPASAAASPQPLQLATPIAAPASEGSTGGPMTTSSAGSATTTAINNDNENANATAAAAANSATDTLNDDLRVNGLTQSPLFVPTTATTATAAPTAATTTSPSATVNNTPPPATATPPQQVALAGGGGGGMATPLQLPTPATSSTFYHYHGGMAGATASSLFMMMGSAQLSTHNNDGGNNNGGNLPPTTTTTTTAAAAVATATAAAAAKEAEENNNINNKEAPNESANKAVTAAGLGIEAPATTDQKAQVVVAAEGAVEEPPAPPPPAVPAAAAVAPPPPPAPPAAAAAVAAPVNRNRNNNNGIQIEITVKAIDKALFISVSIFLLVLLKKACFDWPTQRFLHEKVMQQRIVQMFLQYIQSLVFGGGGGQNDDADGEML